MQFSDYRTELAPDGTKERINDLLKGLPDLLERCSTLDPFIDEKTYQKDTFTWESMIDLTLSECSFKNVSNRSEQ